MGRSPCCEKVGLKKGPWTPEEDEKLLAHIEEHGHGSWRALPAKAGLQRCGKSCRLRWTNYLRPDIKRGKFSLQEEQTIIQLHALLGNRWSAIATHLPKRTDNEIKNYWNTHLKKRLTKMGIDPVTHKPKTDTLGSGSGNPKDAANLSHMAQWESARLEAEARLVRESKLIVATAAINNPSAGPAQKHPNNHYKPGPPCLDILKAWQSSWSTRSNPNNISINSNNNNNNSNALFCMLAMDDLESPTSTLNFPIAATTVVPSSLSLFGDEEDINEENDVLFQAFGANGWFLNNQHHSNVMESVATNTTTTTTMCNVMESFGDVFAYDMSEEDPANEGGGAGKSREAGDVDPGDESCSGASGFFDIQENKSYWNGILNLVNASPSSPVF